MPGYMCVVPSCKSGSMVPAHDFHKDTVRALQWKQAVNSPRLDGLFEHELKKFHVCALHFTEDDVIPSLVRRKFKQDAIPSLLLPRRNYTKKKNAKITQLQIESVTFWNKWKIHEIGGITSKKGCQGATIRRRKCYKGKC
ncbi:uncharacterized protein LOC143211546 [Lasioglossum baleicum]|uniref:uncharacterized protein LOC143211546 n=1 Tax=Lasioglossum baleicum TaxID=434251 RepID=UPI003FCD9F71